MNHLPRNSRRTWSVVARLGTAFSAIMLIVSTTSALTATALPGGTAATAGQSITPTSGNSGTSFTLGLAAPNNACPGDSASGGYLWNTYFVPAAADVAILQYDANGPKATVSGTGAYTLSFAQPLFTSAGTPIVGQTTGVTTGLITPLPTFSFGVFPAGFVPAGDYKIGYACSKAGLTERFWETRITVTTSATGGPAQFTFAVAAPPVTTTTTIAPTTTLASTTTTTPATTTTVANGTTTTIAGGAASTSTTTTLLTSLVSTTPSNSGLSPVQPRIIPVTGSNTTPMIVWACLLLVFGRMAILLARPIKVLPPGSR